MEEGLRLVDGKAAGFAVGIDLEARDGFDGIVVVERLLFAFRGEVGVGLGDIGVKGGESSQAEVDGLWGEILGAEIGDPGGDIGFGDLPGLFEGEAEEELPGFSVGALGIERCVGFKPEVEGFRPFLG